MRVYMFTGPICLFTLFVCLHWLAGRNKNSSSCFAFCRSYLFRSDSFTLVCSLEFNNYAGLERHPDIPERHAEIETWVLRAF